VRNNFVSNFLLLICFVSSISMHNQSFQKSFLVEIGFFFVKVVSWSGGLSFSRCRDLWQLVAVPVLAEGLERRPSWSLPVVSRVRSCCGPVRRTIWICYARNNVF